MVGCWFGPSQGLKVFHYNRTIDIVDRVAPSKAAEQVTNDKDHKAKIFCELWRQLFIPNS